MSQLTSNSNLFSDKQIKQDINKWATYVGLPQKELGGIAVCPFARASMKLYEIVLCNGLSDINPPAEEFELIINVVPESTTLEQLIEKCQQLENQYPLLIFLPDHKDRNTYINGIQTNNGKHNLILCQPRDKLLAAREKLSKTAYYSYWNKEYLNEITRNTNVNLD